MKRIFNDDKIIMVGTITNIAPNEGVATADVTYTVYDKTLKKTVSKTEQITFRDSEASKPVERMGKYDFNGSTLMIKARLKDGKLVGYDFQFPGNIMGLNYKNRNGEDKTAYFYFGKVNIFDGDLQHTANGNTYFKCSGSVSKYVPGGEGEKGTREYEYINFSFWNDDKTNSKLAERASKALGKGDLVIINMSAIKEFDKKDGTKGKSANAYSFDIIEKAKKESDGSPAPDTPSDPAENDEDVASTVFGQIDTEEDEDEDYAF